MQTCIMQNINLPTIERIFDIIRKVIRLVDRKNAARYQHIQKETTPALTTITKIINQDLSKDTRIK